MVTLMFPFAVVEPDVPVIATDCGPPVSVTFRFPLCEAESVDVAAKFALSVCVPKPAKARLTRAIPLLRFAEEL